ncbi:hypothetical protein ABFX02_09G057500 [Erythranthe guttata]
MASFTLIILLLSTFSLLPLSLSLAHAHSFTKIYSFGDSFTDTGNTHTSTGPTAFNYISNPPYGVTFFHHPTNRYSDGRIVLDFLAESLSLPFLPPYRNSSAADQTHGVNFAVGGGCAIRYGFFVKHNVSFNLVPQSLQTQLVWFTKIAAAKGCKLQLDRRSPPPAAPPSKECAAVLGDALIWMGEIGANDYTSSLGSSVPIKTIQTLAVNSVVGFLQVLLNNGAKYIVVQGLPPTGCATYTFALSSPEDRDADGCVASSNRIALGHNAALKVKLDSLRKQYPEAVILYADYYNAHLTVLRNPRKYGIVERYKACCGFGGGEFNFDIFNTCGTASSAACANPSEYINWDGAHFTEAMNKVLANSFFNGTYCDPPFSYLLSKKLRSG